MDVIRNSWNVLPGVRLYWGKERASEPHWLRRILEVVAVEWRPETHLAGCIKVIGLVLREDLEELCQSTFWKQKHKQRRKD